MTTEELPYYTGRLPKYSTELKVTAAAFVVSFAMTFVILTLAGV